MADQRRPSRRLRQLPQQLAWTLAWTLALGATLVAGAARAAEGTRVGSFDFGYVSSGDSQIRPVQVFDDGHDTFLQFRLGAPVPAIFSSSADGPQLLTPQAQGPYLKLPALHRRLLLQLGSAQALVLHGSEQSAQAAPRPGADVSAAFQIRAAADPAARSALGASPALAWPSAAAMGLVDDDPQRNSYAIPRRGDAVRWTQADTAHNAYPADHEDFADFADFEDHAEREERALWFRRGTATLSTQGRQQLAAVARGLPADARLVLIGRDDDSDQPGLAQRRAAVMQQVLAKAGVPLRRMEVQVGPPAAHKEQEWASSLITQLPAPSRPGNEPSLRASLQVLVRSGALQLEDAEALARDLPQARAVAAAAGRTAAATASSWDIRQSDGSVEKMLGRWALAAGWTLVWDRAPAIPINGDLRLPPSDFLGAADQVLRRAQELGYRIRATAYSNQTLVVGTP